MADSNELSPALPSGAPDTAPAPAPAPADVSIPTSQRLRQLMGDSVVADPGTSPAAPAEPAPMFTSERLRQLMNEAPEAPNASAPMQAIPAPAPVPASENSPGALSNAWTVTNDTVNSAGRQLDRAGAGAVHLLGYLSSLGGHVYDPHYLYDMGNRINAREDADEASRAGDYGAPYSNAVGKAAGDMLDAELGGKLIGLATRALPLESAGAAGTASRIGRNLLTGEGGALQKATSAAAAGGTVAGLTGDDWKAGAATGAGLALGGALAGKAIPYVAGKAGNATRSVLNRLDPDGAPNRTPSDPSGPGPTGNEGGASQPEDAAGTRPKQQAERDAASKIGMFVSPKDAPKVAAGIIRTFGKGGSTELQPSEIPGVYLTRAEATGNAGEADLQAAVRDMNPNPFDLRDAANNEARKKFLTGIAGTPHDIEDAESAQREFEATNREAAFGDEQPVHAQHLLDQLDEIHGSNVGNPSVQAKIQQAREAVQAAIDENGQAMPSHLWNARKFIGYGLQKAAMGDQSDLRAASAQLTPYMDDLAYTIDQGAPGFRDYLRGYSDRAKTIDEMRFLQGRSLINSDGRMTIGPMARLMEDLRKADVSQRDMPASIVSPGKREQLDALYRDLQKQANVGKAKSVGSNSRKNFLASSKMADMMSGASPLAGAIGGVLVDHVTGSLPQAGAAVVGSRVGGAMLRARQAAARDAVLEELTHRILNP